MEMDPSPFPLDAPEQQQGIGHAEEESGGRELHVLHDMNPDDGEGESVTTLVTGDIEASASIHPLAGRRGAEREHHGAALVGERRRRLGRPVIAVLELDALLDAL